MPRNPDPARRRSIRLQGHDYSAAGAYFLTICTQDRVCVLGHITGGEVMLSPFGETASEVWLQVPLKYQNVELDEFVVMPNHIHGIVAITDSDVGAVGAVHELPLPGSSGGAAGAIHELPLQSRQERRRMLIPRVVGYFKMNSGKRINEQRGTPGAAVWQRNYYEHVVRNERELNAIRQYIDDNPLQWDLDDDNPQVYGRQRR